MGEEKKESEVRVSDRRRFTEEGQSRDGEPAESAAESAGAAASAESPPETVDPEAPERTAEQQEGAPEGQQDGPLPEINFTAFIFSLSSSALIHLGLAPDPMSGEQRKDLALAKQTIDILGMLEEKTRGNLSDDEAQLMKNILYDLRMRYVADSRQGS